MRRSRDLVRARRRFRQISGRRSETGGRWRSDRRPFISAVWRRAPALRGAMDGGGASRSNRSGSRDVACSGYADGAASISPGAGAPEADHNRIRNGRDTGSRLVRASARARGRTHAATRPVVRSGFRVRSLCSSDRVFLHRISSGPETGYKRNQSRTTAERKQKYLLPIPTAI